MKQILVILIVLHFNYINNAQIQFEQASINKLVKISRNDFEIITDSNSLFMTELMFDKKEMSSTSKLNPKQYNKAIQVSHFNRSINCKDTSSLNEKIKLESIITSLILSHKAKLYHHGTEINKVYSRYIISGSDIWICLYIDPEYNKMISKMKYSPIYYK